MPTKLVDFEVVTILISNYRKQKRIAEKMQDLYGG